jgi:serine/threonine protein kinase
MESAELDVFEGKYTIEKEIYVGNMSKIFLARNTKIGNQWIIKFISTSQGSLANEKEILKLLNHINLPQIVDVFENDKGIYLVESYIEGESLENVLNDWDEEIGHVVIKSWFEQLAQVIQYLHSFKNHPIHHFDLKPSNIMVTHDNKLVLIDFGISKRAGIDDNLSSGVSYYYAAPEQIPDKIHSGFEQVVEERFGHNFSKDKNWKLDARTDIYSLGAVIYRAVMGKYPVLGEVKKIYERIPNELAAIILKCIEMDPEKRYQSIEDILIDLQKLNLTKFKMIRTLFFRKVAFYIASIAFIGGILSMLSSTYILGQEELATISVAPNVLTISLQQTGELIIKKQMPNGKIIKIDTDQVKWSNENHELLRFDGNRVIGMNLGKMEMKGYYRDKLVEIQVEVVNPMNNMAEISQRYDESYKVSKFLGTHEREWVDGINNEAECVSPESIAYSHNNDIYFTDSGLLRKITDGQVETIHLEPSYIRFDRIRTFEDELFLLTSPWQEEETNYFAIIKYNGTEANTMYLGDANSSNILDYKIAKNGDILFIEQNDWIGKTYLKKIAVLSQEVEIITELPSTIKFMEQGKTDDLYFSAPESGLIYLFQDNELKYFLGAENERHFIDGTAPLFYEPQQMVYKEDKLFIWDFNTLRCVTIFDNGSVNAYTVAGEASPDFHQEIDSFEYTSDEMIFPNSRLTEMLIYDDTIFITDPKRSIIWTIY